MKKPLVTAALALTLAMGTCALAGCSGSAKQDVNADTPAGAAPVMPAGHEDRFDNLGANGCYGCHGANDKANPMLNGATALPNDHYAGGSTDSREIDPTHEQCNTCHVQS